VCQTDSLEQGIADVDIVYSTRIQEERFASAEGSGPVSRTFPAQPKRLYRQLRAQYSHHAPLAPRFSRRARELDVDLNDNPNLAIFRQSDNGVLVRMALFALILDVADQVDQHSAPVDWYTERRF